MDFAMVSTGAAFRLTWDTTSWNGGNVDVMHTFDEPEGVYRLGIESLGRNFHILTRATNHCDINISHCLTATNTVANSISNCFSMKSPAFST